MIFGNKLAFFTSQRACQVTDSVILLATMLRRLEQGVAVNVAEDHKPLVRGSPSAARRLLFAVPHSRQRLLLPTIMR